MKYPLLIKKRRLFKIPTIIIVLLLCSVSYGVDEAWLFDCYRSGDIDTIRSMLDNIPDTTAAGQFFRGVFESDGETARFYYDRIVALWPGSPSEAWALERLWQYHYSKGDMTQAEKYFNFLKLRHPDHPGIENKPDFKAESGLSKLIGEHVILPTEELLTTPGRWRVQLGAFSKRAGAKKIARKVVKYGAVDLVTKEVNGRNLTVVMMGRFHRKEEAEKLADKIRRETGIKGIVTTAEKINIENRSN